MRSRHELRDGLAEQRAREDVGWVVEAEVGARERQREREGVERGGGQGLGEDAGAGGYDKSEMTGANGGSSSSRGRGRRTSCFTAVFASSAISTTRMARR